MYLSLAVSSCSGHSVESVLLVDEVLLFPVEELLGVVDALAGEGPDAGGQVGQLGVLVRLPLGATDHTHLGGGHGQTGQGNLAQVDIDVIIVSDYKHFSLEFTE